MKKIFLPSLVLASLVMVKCGPKKNADDEVMKDISKVNPMKYAETITASDLKDLLYVYASDEFEGRETGEPGQKKAVEFLKNFYVDNKIQPAIEGNYFQTVPESFFKAGSGIKASENVLAFIKGSTKPDEILVVSSHLDHIGVTDDGVVNNGADDDGSGSVSVLEIAQAFQQAVKDGYRPHRSILFLHVTGEEKGLYGSRYYTENPVFPLKNTIADLNIDMIGRKDFDHPNDDNYIYLIGSEMLSTELHEISEQMNDKYINLTLDYKYDAPDDPNRFYYRSDHYNFAKNNIPVIFYFNGVHADYHKPTDTPDKIEYPLMAKRARLVFLTAWELANRPDRITVDK